MLLGQIRGKSGDVSVDGLVADSSAFVCSHVDVEFGICGERLVGYVFLESSMEVDGEGSRDWMRDWKRVDEKQSQF